MHNKLTAVILTLDEEQFIGRCIRALDFCDEVVVVDSCSTDQTTTIAADLGARVVLQPWLGWSAQRAVGIASARNDWVLIIEADEMVTPALRRSICALDLAAVRMSACFSVDRRGDFLGVLLPNEARRKRVESFVRLFHRDFGEYDPAARVHERVLTSESPELLDGPLLHWRGAVVEEYLSMLNRYSTEEARMLDDQKVRPRAWKIIGVPMARFVWLYIVKREFQLGARGLIHALMKANADFARYAKHWEAHHTERVLHPPSASGTEPRRPPRRAVTGRVRLPVFRSSFVQTRGEGGES